MKVLWVDDDAPSEPADIGNTSVLTAGNCPDAVELIDQLASELDAIVVDLILPQHGWGSSFLTYPGLELVRYIVQAFSDELPVAVYTVVDGDDILAQASEAGARWVFSKRTHAFADVLDSLVNQGSSP